MMKKFEIDVAVALVFFNRPEPLKQVFNSIKQARPSKLFLIQDGAREHVSSDAENIAKCRDIVAGVDWECKVYTNYSENNLGCGKRVHSGISWAFENVDRLIILEDDCLPSYSFYSFCKEVLEKYIEDPRVGMISGMNHLNKFEKIPYDYLFARVGSIAGWATWKRAWETIDYDMNFLEEEDTVRLLSNYFNQSSKTKGLVKIGLQKKELLRKGKKLSSWSYQRGINDYLNSALIVVPKYNLMSNIGLTSESVHSVDSIKKVPRGMRSLYQLKLFEIEFPLLHPKYIIEDIEYNNLVNGMMNPNIFIQSFRRLESLIYRLLYGDKKEILKFLKRLRK